MKKKKNETVLLNERRPYWDDEPNGYLESDRDFVLNNIDLCVEYLEKLSQKNKAKVNEHK